MGNAFGGSGDEVSAADEMRAFDDLPQPVRSALRCAAMDWSAVWARALDGSPEEVAAYITGWDDALLRKHTFDTYGEDHPQCPKF